MTPTEGTAPAATGPERVPATAPGGRDRWLPRWQRVSAGAAAGALLALSMPPRSAWYLAPAGAAVLTWALVDLRWRQRLVLGVWAGLGFFAPTLSWLTDFHPAGFAAVLVIEVALFAGAMLLADVRRERWWTVPAALVALEAVRGRFPFGGFPLPGIALGQLDGPFVAAAPLGGSLLVTGLAVGAGAAVTGLVVTGQRIRTPLLVAAIAGSTTAGAALAAPDGGLDAELRAALVQGGGPRGIPAVRSDEQAVTERLFDVSADLPPDLDLVLWPESSVVVTGPVAENGEADRVAALARRTGATVVAGVTESGATTFRNAAVAWGPDGRILGRYEKVYRVPFGEYIPGRGLFERLSDMTELVPRDVVPGRGPGLLETPAGPLGVVISSEVFFSDRPVPPSPPAARSCWYRPTPPPTPPRRCRRPRWRPPGCGPGRRTAPSCRPHRLGTPRSCCPTASVAAQGELGTPELLTATVPLRTGLTPYARTGDLPVLLAVTSALVAGPALRLLHRRRRAADTSR